MVEYKDANSDALSSSVNTDIPHSNSTSSIHRPKLYKRTTSSQVSLRRFSILQSDTEISDDHIKPSLSHQESDVEVFTNDRVITNDELISQNKLDLDNDEIFSSSSLKDKGIENNLLTRASNSSVPHELTPATSSDSIAAERSLSINNVLSVKFVDYFLDNIKYGNSETNIAFKQEILQIIKLLFIKSWLKTDLVPEKLILRKISGAMTNAIYQLSYESSTKLPSLLLRVYGPNVDSIIDRDYELQVLARLSNLKIGPKLFGCFNNGRFEEFLEDSITLTKEEVKKDEVSVKVAKRMRELHFFVPLTKDEKREGSITWKRVDNWLASIQAIDKKTLQYVTQFDNFELLKQAISKYKQYLDQYLINSRLSFTHCDTQYGNLLDVNNEIVVIDFEYSGPNPPAFDIANHFSEWMHDYHSSKPELLNPQKYPTEKQIETFLKAYNFSDIDSLKKDIILSRPLVNIHWGLWGILQSGVLGNNKDSKKEIALNDDNVAIEVHEEGEGASIDTFDFLLYARHKFKVVLGDWINMGLIDKKDSYSATFI
ncbi:uncharacterized protein HGUI_02404 [Hanseniaspora guilliermondii]|uniref:Choline kinase N-terminal domain-containing protein n=1 Tax=Hanseniaspora guilliermondii TaxID=56406 RepID=A0A1L0B326_9ASCO|nr:uncharacterized protein HGUI_02404 [Hanseniaspora guilliermondii]